MKLAIFSVFAVFLAFVASARSDSVQADIYLVKNVKVDATAKTASEAKIIAMKEGQVEAFRKLINRLSNSPRAQTLFKLPATEIGRLVRGISVAEERTAAKRYIAELNIAFQPAAVRSLMTQFSIPFSDQQASPVLLLPVYIDDGRLILWDDPNPVREGWSNINPDEYLLPLVLPNGGIGDIQAISAEDAFQGVADKLDAIRARYKASEILVVVAEFNESNTQLRVTLSGTSPLGDILIDRAYEGSPDNVVEIVQKAAISYMLELENRWKTTGPVASEADGNRFLVTVPFASFREWKGIRTRINNTEGVLRMDIRALSQRGAVIYITFAGEHFELEDRLMPQGLIMRDMGDGWVLTAEN